MSTAEKGLFIFVLWLAAMGVLYRQDRKRNTNDYSLRSRKGRRRMAVHSTILFAAGLIMFLIAQNWHL